MVKLEKEVRKWQNVWEVTKAVGEIGVYAGIIGLGYYIGKEIANEGVFGAILAGVVCTYHQDAKNGVFDDVDVEGL